MRDIGCRANDAEVHHCLIAEINGGRSSFGHVYSNRTRCSDMKWFWGVNYNGRLLSDGNDRGRRGRHSSAATGGVKYHEDDWNGEYGDHATHMSSKFLLFGCCTVSKILRAVS